MERTLPALLHRWLTSDPPTMLDAALFLVLSGLIGYMSGALLGPPVAVAFAYAVLLADRLRR